MPTSDTDALDRIRDMFLAAIADRDAAHARESRIMSHLHDLIENGRRLAAERVDLIADRDAQRERADKAEAQIAADDETARAAKEALDAEIAKEAGLGAKASSDDGQDEKKDAAADREDGSRSEPVVTTSPTGATVTVDPAGDAVRHVAPDGATTLLPHDGSPATATDASGAAIEPHPAAVAEAAVAASIAGVAIQPAA